MNRVIIIGSQGSGKTTLARHIAGSLFSLNDFEQGQIILIDDVKQTYPKGHNEVAVTPEFGEEGGGEVKSPVYITCFDADALDPDHTPRDVSVSMDGRVWAAEFMRSCVENPSVPYDLGSMVGWFANALMKGHDEARNKYEEEITKVTDIAVSPGNAFADKYMYGMANGLILAQSILRGVDPEYLVWPEKPGTDTEVKD